MFMKRIAVIVGLSFHYPSMAYLSQRKKGRLCIRIGWCSGLIYQPQGQFQRPFFYFFVLSCQLYKQKDSPCYAKRNKKSLAEICYKIAHFILPV
jgi:hypothetical protein